MARLIDADALLRDIDDLLKGHYSDANYKMLRRFFFKVVRRIKAAPTVTSTDDLISRQALLKSIKSSTAVREVKVLAQVFAETEPSVNPEQPWIPVTERLPIQGETVFAWAAPFVSKAWRNEKGDWVTTNGPAASLKPVTHWMPMPEPPKAE